MKKIFSIMATAVAVAALMGSCRKDDTNYSYPSDEEVKAGEIVIDTVGTDRNVFWKEWGQDATIEYSLNVKYSTPQNLRYTWVAVPYPYRAVAEGNTTKYPDADTLCVTKDLKFQCKLSSGWHTVYFIVEDTVKGISQHMQFDNYITVATAGAVPNMVYCLEEMPDGTVDIDAFGTPDALIYTVGHEKNTYTTRQPGNAIEGKPLFMAKGANWFYVVTDKEFRRLSKVGWQTMDLGADMFYQAPATIKPEAINSTNGCEWLVNDGKLYCINNVTEANRKFPVAIPGEYKVLPYLAQNTMTSWGHVADAIDASQLVFDDNAKAMRPYFGKATSLSFFGAAEGTNAFNYNAMPADAEVVYIGQDMGDNEIAIVTKEPTGYYANVLCAYNVVDNGLLARGRHSMAGLQDLDKAEHFEVSSQGSAIYYTVGNKFYSWAYNSGRTAANLVNEFPANEQITAIKVIPSGGYPSAGWAVWIATWDEAAKDGKVYEIFVDPVSGDPGMVWGVMGHADLQLVDNGFGKIVSFCCP